MAMANRLRPCMRTWICVGISEVAVPLAPSAAAVRWGVKPAVWLLALAPAAWLAWAIYRALQGDGAPLGADPAETIVHLSGETAIRALLATLLVGALRDLFAMRWIVRIRRLLGLFAFFWGVLHLGSYLWLELDLGLGRLAEDFRDRPYILAGGVGLLSMLPLAITSTNGWRRRLGRRWNSLHKLVWVSALAVCVHLLWQARSDLAEAVLYALLFGTLAIQRLWTRRPHAPPSRSEQVPVEVP